MQLQTSCRTRHTHNARGKQGASCLPPLPSHVAGQHRAPRGSGWVPAAHQHIPNPFPQVQGVSTLHSPTAGGCPPATRRTPASWHTWRKYWARRLKKKTQKKTQQPASSSSSHDDGEGGGGQGQRAAVEETRQGASAHRARAHIQHRWACTSAPILKPSTAHSPPPPLHPTHTRQ